MSEPTMVDQLAEDTKTADQPPEYPDGAPKFWPLMRSPYDRRPAAIRAYGEIQNYIKANPDIQKDSDDAESADDPEVDWDAAAESYQLVQLLDRFLGTVAKDPDEYKDWPDRFDADTFMKTWAAYQGTHPGEAPSSSS